MAGGGSEEGAGEVWEEGPGLRTMTVGALDCLKVIRGHGSPKI